jgi:deoxyribodipyrimidine photolyase
VKRAVVLFTRDLRVHDHAASSAAVELASKSLPLFVLDDALWHQHRSPARRAFLLDASSGDRPRRPPVRATGASRRRARARRRLGAWLWIEDEDGLTAWAEGRTGYPIVDAAMRQLRAEGWMHNHGRLLVASFLTKTLGIDWRRGAKVFLDVLVDGDVANNAGNWQWVAETGVDSRPNRVFNPIAQAKRLDPQGEYVHTHVPELGELKGSTIHEPCRAPLAARAPEYPEQIVDLEQRAARA